MNAVQRIRTRFKTGYLRLCSSLVSLALCGFPAAPVSAGTTTVGIINSTVQALPGCLRYEVRGVCFFLTCSTVACWIDTSVRVRHYVPDVIVSSYNDPLQHPWTEVGKPLARAMSGVGSALTGTVLDSSANTSANTQHNTVGQAMVTFKSVDVIGNPVGMLGSAMAGGIPELPSSLPAPGMDELLKFSNQELPRIAQEWRSVPAQTGNALAEAARAVAQAPAQVMGKIADVQKGINSAQSALGPVKDVLSGTIDTNSIGSSVSKLTGVDLAGLRQVGQTVQAISGGSQSLLCPGSASAFTLHFQSDLDGLFWRGLVPLELLYPASWFPGSNEVSQGSGLISTWGSRYPRTGDVIQPHPVKASAVLVERAADIVKRPAQAHIYKRLQDVANSGGYQVFESQGVPEWQMVYPRSSGCVQFGQNDSLSLISFGDARTSAEAGYIWNLWQRYDCCSKTGAVFLFTIP